MADSKAPGVFDILPQDPKEKWRSSYLWQHVEEVIRQTAKDYTYQEIRTPIFERTELFTRGIGEGTDIVSKEMYTFEDRGGRSLTLRPEGTASVVRAFIEGQLHTVKPVHKLFYIGPMFRYERQQAGRYRQHHQFGAEAFGNNSPEQDAELIDLVHTLYIRLGLKGLEIDINNIGSASVRKVYREKLLDYLKSHHESLSEDSKRRVETNPLRVLDSKDEHDRAIVKNAPSLLDCLDEESSENFEQLKKLLDLLKIPYKVNPLLVRGLDYYNHCVFEVISGTLGAQNSVGGGGRYDGLMTELGGPDIPTVGFATGIERVIQTMIGQNVELPKAPAPDLLLIPLGGAAKAKCFKLLHDLRAGSISCDMDFSGRKLGKIMQSADASGVKFVAVVGDEELSKGTLELKEMASGNSEKIALDALYQKITG